MSKLEGSTALNGQKHAMLESSINNLDGISENLQRIIHRIKGEEPEDCPKVQPPVNQSLNEMLISGHANIDQHRDRAYELMNELEGLLF